MGDVGSQWQTRAQQILAENRRGDHTIPAAHLYPHQWLWDSCFSAIGLSHYEPSQATAELKSLVAAQWANGMVPSMVFSATTAHWLGPGFWRSRRIAGAPSQVETSGITQPPMLSIAALAVADQLPQTEDKVFLRSIYPNLLAYHQWLYRERDPRQEGLIVLLHSWESGLDNSPVWMEVLKNIPNPLWLTTFLKLKFGQLFGHFRPDTKAIAADQRLGQAEAVRLLHRAISLRKNRYNSKVLIKKSWFLVEDLIFNSILITANRALFDIATIIGEDLPAELSFKIQKTEQALEKLWDEESGQYYSRNFRTQKLIKTPTIATFLPLYTNAISKNRAASLVSLLTQPGKFWSAWPVPTVALDSPYFGERHYWQGPTWINMNWFIVNGLMNYDYYSQAEKLRYKTQQLIENSGFYEYFSPLSGEGYGAKNFSWTAALYIDLAHLDTKGPHV